MAKKKIVAKGKFTSRTDKVGKFLVETWYDRTSRTWITEVKTSKHGEDVREHGSDQCGSESDARHYHEQALIDASRLQ